MLSLSYFSVVNPLTCNNFEQQTRQGVYMLSYAVLFGMI